MHSDPLSRALWLEEGVILFTSLPRVFYSYSCRVRFSAPKVEAAPEASLGSARPRRCRTHGSSRTSRSRCGSGGGRGPGQKRSSGSRASSPRWVRTRYEQIYEAAHAAAATDSSNALDAKRTRHFLAQCRLSPERMESVMKTVNPNNNSSIDSTTFVKARPARPALQARAAACALPHVVLHHVRRSAATQSQASSRAGHAPHPLRQRRLSAARRVTSSAQQLRPRATMPFDARPQPTREARRKLGSQPSAAAPKTCVRAQYRQAVPFRRVLPRDNPAREKAPRHATQDSP